MPATVRDAILSRIGRLSPLAQQLLEIASVLTPYLTFDLILAAAGRDEMESAERLEELTAQQFLIADDNGFRFQHDLARETVYRNITQWRRQLLHKRAANGMTVLPSHDDVEVAAAIARHYEEATENTQAITFYRRAAQAATTKSAYREAVVYLERAISLAATATITPDLLAVLQEALADNLTIAGDFTNAEKAYQVALSLIPAQDVVHSAELERKLASTLPPQLRLEEAESRYRSTLTRLDNMPPSTETRTWQTARLSILLSLLDTLYFQLNAEAMIGLQSETEALLSTVGTNKQQSDYHFRLNQIAHIESRFHSVKVANPFAALTYAEKSGDPWLIARQQFQLGFHFLWSDTPPAAKRPLQQALAAAEELGDVWLQVQVRTYLSIFFRLKGQIENVSMQQSHLLQIAETVGDRNYIGVALSNAAWLNYRSGEWSKADAQAKVALSHWDRYPFQWLANWVILAVALHKERIDDAVTTADSLLHPKQQQLPDRVEQALATAVAAWQTNEVAVARHALNKTVAIASQHGYL
jgi:tetratricopeptide (TPR) repeat protein